MAESVRKLSYASDIEEWIDALFSGQEGYVYVPTKHPKTGQWKPHFFEYPKKKTELITHVVGSTTTKEVYMAPSLFSAPVAKRENWLGTNYVWTEFDGNAPDGTLPANVPSPSIRIQSSTKGHEHWYWRLESFQTDLDFVQGLSRKLTYALNADKSAWDANQVLRPPGTVHHDTRRRVRALAAQNQVVSIADFAELASAPTEIEVETEISNLPDVKEVTQKFKFPKDARDLFNKAVQPKGSRSSAMMRMAFHCIEMGMTNEETYVVLINCDDRWGKYKNRTQENRARVLAGMIAHARNEKALQAEIRLTEYEPMYSIRELLDLDFSKIEWTYDGVLADNSFTILAADPDTGKSTFAMQMGLHIARAADFLEWQYGHEQGQRVGFFSYEMDSRQCGHFLQTMYGAIGQDERAVVDQRFYIRPTGFAIPLDRKDEQQKFLDYVDQKELQFIVIDSIKAIGALREEKFDKIQEFIDKDLRSERGCTVLAIHHNRKPPAEGRQPEQSLADLYGDVFIQASAVHVLALRGKGKSIEVAQVKNRLDAHFNPFPIIRTDGMNFKVKNSDKSNSTTGDGSSSNGGGLGLRFHSESNGSPENTDDRHGERGDPGTDGS